MKLAMLRGRATGTEDIRVSRPTEEPRLCLVGKGAAVLPWPVESQEPHAANQQLEPVTITAEVRMRRFSNDRVREERYAATASTVDRSPRAILAALAERFEALDDDDITATGEGRLIVEVRVVA